MLDYNCKALVLVFESYGLIEEVTGTSHASLSFPFHGEIKPIHFHFRAMDLCLTVLLLIAYYSFHPPLFHHSCLFPWTCHLPDLTYVSELQSTSLTVHLMASTPLRLNSQMTSLEPFLNALGRYKLKNSSSLIPLSCSLCLQIMVYLSDSTYSTVILL